MSASTLHGKALALLDKEEFDEAERLLALALKMDPHHVLAHLSLGLLDQRQGQSYRAARHLESVLRLLHHRGEHERVGAEEALTVSWLRKAAERALSMLETKL